MQLAVDKVEEYNQAGVLTQAGDFFASQLLNAERKEQEAFIKQYVSGNNAALLQTHALLRKAVFYLVFNEQRMQNVDVDTFFNLLVLFASKNVVKCVEYVQTCNRSILIKMANYLRTKADMGFNLEYTDLEQTLFVLFSAQNLAETVLTPQFFASLRSLKSKTWECDLLLKIGSVYALDGPVYTLRQIFPHLLPTTCHALLVCTKFNIDELTIKLLDTPVDEILKVAKPVNDTLNESKPVDLEQKRQRNLKYWLDDDADEMTVTPDVEGEEKEDFEEDYDDLGISSEKSVADKNLDNLQAQLWTVYNADSSVFEPSQRGSQKRKELRKQLNGWTDEQIEGWARVVGSKVGSNYFTKTKRPNKPNKPNRPNKQEKPENKQENPANKPANKPGNKQENKGNKPAIKPAPDKRERERNQRRRETKISNQRKKKETKLAPRDD